MDNDATVTIDLGDGQTVECAVLMIFDAGDEGQEYIAVVPEDSDDDVYLYRYFEDENGEPHLDNIESDAEYEMVSEQFDELLDEQEYNDAVCAGGTPQSEEDAY